MALLSAGANGATFHQIKDALHLPGDKYVIADQFSNSVNQLTYFLGNATIKTANKIYVADGAIIKAEYKDLAVNKFNSDIESTNFVDRVGSADKINTWAAEHTENRIKDVISPVDLDRNTRLILLNAVYFKARWQYPFNKYSTAPADFHVDATQTKTTDFMHITEHFKYGEFAEFEAKAVELPYADSDITFLVIVPNKINGLSQVHNHLKDHDLQSISNVLTYKETKVTIPKFEVEYKVVLNEKLQAVSNMKYKQDKCCEFTWNVFQLGINDVFGNADLGDILENSGGLQVSKVVQKAFIKVDEGGAEAAAITGTNEWNLANTRKNFQSTKSPTIHKTQCIFPTVFQQFDLTVV